MEHKGDRLVWEVCLFAIGFVAGMMVSEPAQAAVVVVARPAPVVVARPAPVVARPAPAPAPKAAPVTHTEPVHTPVPVMMPIIVHPTTKCDEKKDKDCKK